MALFNLAGVQVATNDDDGPGGHAQLSFGFISSRGVTTYPALENGRPLAGQDGQIAGGTHYLAVSAWNLGSSSGLNAYSDYVGSQRSTMLHIRTMPNPTDLRVVSAWATLVLPGESSTLVTAAVEPGSYPQSSALTVTADLSVVGGAAAQPLYDDGTHGDTVPGDFVFSAAVAMTASWPAGVYTLAVNAGDGQGRTASGSALLYLATPPLGVIAGSDDDLSTADLYTFTVSRARPWGQGQGEVGVVWTGFRLTSAAANDGAPAVSTYLDLDTNGTAAPATTVGGLGDTEVAVFRADGTLAANNDDGGVNRNSALSFGDTAPHRPLIGNASPRDGSAGNLAAGDYYVAVGVYPTEFGASAFNATTASEAWVEAILNFRTNLPTRPCSPADVGAQGGVAERDDRLDNNDFIIFIDLFFEANPHADFGSQGGRPGADGSLDNNDFIVFIDEFFDGQGACSG